MKISLDQKLINRNKKISQFVLYLSLALLLLGFLWSFSGPDASQTITAYIILIPAYILVQISIFMANKWGRSPRPDEIVERSLKGMSDHFTLYNYTTPVPHLLVGPAGIWIIKPYHQSGEISYNPEKKRFEQRGGANIIAKLFAQESLPNIEKDSQFQMQKLNSYFHTFELNNSDEIKVVNIFYSEKADVHSKNAPEVTLHADKLKEFIRSQAKLVNMNNEQVLKIKSKLPEPEK